MSKPYKFFVLLISFVLYGCVGPLVPVVKIDQESASQIRVNMKVYNRSDLQDGSYTRLGPIESTSCMNKIWDTASKEDAVNQLLYKSSILGGNGITDLVCGEEGTSLSKNCWKSYTCYAAAIKTGNFSNVGRNGKGGKSSGTGFAISNNGHILTNSHVISGASSITVFISGESYIASVIREDNKNDLALIKINNSTIPVVFRDDSKIRVGESIVAIGFPLANVLAKEPNVTTGNVSALAGINDDIRFLQITAPIQLGNSGGPILDESGRVIGIAVSKLNALKAAIVTGDIPQNVNFAIKSSLAKTFIEMTDINIQSSNISIRIPVADISDKTRNSVAYIECQ